MYIKNMAIQKNIETEYGVNFKYHKITDVRINTRSGKTQLVITVASYLDKDARINNKDAVYHECIISGADFALTPFYALLKAKFKDFASGQDDFDNAFKGPQVQNDVTYVQQTPQGNNAQKWIEKADVSELETAAAQNTEVKE